MSDWRAEEEARRYRAQVRETMRRFSDQALAYQDSIIRGGIDREECDSEIARRQAPDYAAANEDRARP